MKNFIAVGFLLSVALSPFSVFAQTPSFCLNQAVVYTQDGTHYDATITEIYADGSVELTFPNGEFTVSQVPVSTLSVHLATEGGFHVGDAVTYLQNDVNYDAKVLELYTDGSAELSFPHGEFTISQVPLSAVSAHITSLRGFTVGSAVVYLQEGVHYNAKIDELYSDGVALVEFPNGEFAPSQVPITQLSFAFSCTQACPR
jgi:hypothetical protein